MSFIKDILSNDTFFTNILKNHLSKNSLEILYLVDYLFFNYIFFRVKLWPLNFDTSHMAVYLVQFKAFFLNRFKVYFKNSLFSFKILNFTTMIAGDRGHKYVKVVKSTIHALLCYAIFATQPWFFKCFDIFIMFLIKSLIISLQN